SYGFLLGAQDAAALGRVDHGTELRARLRLVPDLEPLEEFALRVDEVVRDLAIHVHPVDRAAGLPVVLVRVPPDQACDQSGVGVREDDRRPVAAHLALHARAVFVAGAQDLLADARRTREGNESDAGVLGDAAAGDLAAAGEHVDDPAGEARLLGQL